MKKLLRVFLLLVLFFGVMEPVAAVFEERDLYQTLRVLRAELKHVYNRTAKAREAIRASRENQQKQMIELMEDCNELSIILYSQKQNFIFDLTYALEEVSKRYRTFARNRRPFVDIITQMDIEIERYQKLIYTLKRIPPVRIEELDSLHIEDSTFIMASRLQEETRQLVEKNLGGRLLQDRRQKPLQDKAAPEPTSKPKEIIKAEEAAKPEITEKIEATDSAQTATPDSLATNNDSVVFQRPTKASEIIKAIANTVFSGDVDKDENDETKQEKQEIEAALDSVNRENGTQYTFLLSGQALQNRDSCLVYSEALLAVYQEARESIIADSVNYNATWVQLQEAYNYAQNRYLEVQRKIFIEGQTGYYSILKRFKNNWRRVRMDMADKWGASSYASTGVRSQWRLQNFISLVLFVLFYLIISIGLSHLIVKILKRKVKFFRSERFRNHGQCMVLFIIVVVFAVAITIAMMSSDQNFMKMGTRLLVEFAWLLAAIFLSFAIRLKADQVGAGLRAYVPIMALCLIIIFIRISFAPNSLINVILPPLLLIFSLWQGRVCRKLRARLPFYDMVYNLITLLVLLASTVMAFSGYVFLSILVVIWWIFQLTVIQTITAASDMIKLYYEHYMLKRKKAYRINHSFLINKKVKGSHIEVTWLYDLLRKAILPVASVWSIPMCVYMASRVFDLSMISVSFLQQDFLNYKALHLSVTKILTAISLAFAFNCICYVAKAFYRVYKIRSTLARTGQKELPENMINFTLSNSIISVIVWGIYIVTCFVLLHIPSTAISIIGAGLATGVGFAMKDVINNFFYGVSLMSGRLRVGDYVECDGIRGVVDSINYQSTLIETEHGSIMAFPNSNLYNKNFKNLTRNNAYELLILPVGIKYGNNVDNVRSLLKKALIKLNVKDKYDRDILDSKYGIVVRLSEFGENSIVLKVYQYVLVTERYKYAAAANEVIYSTLNKNNIEIPFPQRDIYIKRVPEEKEIGTVPTSEL